MAEAKKVKLSKDELAQCGLDLAKKQKELSELQEAYRKVQIDWELKVNAARDELAKLTEMACTGEKVVG